jgi:hypothetical protein
VIVLGLCPTLLTTWRFTLSDGLGRTSEENEMALRNKASTAVVYGGLPIVNHLRELPDDIVLGAMRAEAEWK